MTEGPPESKFRRAFFSKESREGLRIPEALPFRLSYFTTFADLPCVTSRLGFVMAGDGSGSMCAPSPYFALRSSTYPKSSARCGQAATLTGS